MYLGIILHLISRISFVLGSYGMHFFLGRYLSESGYGIVGTVITIMNFEYIFFTDGVQQSMSRALSCGLYNKKSVLRTGAVFQILIAGLFFIITLLGAGLISASLGDASITPYIRNLAFLLPFTGLYSLMLGIMNGHKAFAIEAGVSTIYPILKLSVIPCVLFVFTGDPILGVQAGFMFAAGMVSVISLISVIKILKTSKEASAGTKAPSDDDPCKNPDTDIIKYKDFLPDIPPAGYISTAAGYLMLFGATTFMMNLDTLILKSVSGDNELVGYYTGVVNFAKIPYYLLTACYTVALPVITGHFSKGELSDASKKIGDILTLILSFILPVVIVVAAASGQVLSLFYRPSYKVGANALAFLIFGIAFLGMLLFYSTVLSGADKKLMYLGASLTALILQAVLCVVFTRAFSITGTGAATFLASLTGMLICHFLVKKVFGGFWRPIHTGLLLFNLTAFLVFMFIFRNFYTSTKFLTLVISCGICFAISIIPGVIIMFVQRRCK